MEGASREMPRYKSHKEVHALKIAKVEPCENSPALRTETDDGAVITPVEEGYAPFTVTRGYVNRHNPKVGGYYVVYADGYKSWSPAEAFEEGYMLAP